MLATGASTVCHCALTHTRSQIPPEHILQRASFVKYLKKTHRMEISVFIGIPLLSKLQSLTLLISLPSSLSFCQDWNSLLCFGSLGIFIKFLYVLAGEPFFPFPRGYVVPDGASASKQNWKVNSLGKPLLLFSSSLLSTARHGGPALNSKSPGELPEPIPRWVGQRTCFLRKDAIGR